jgi:hypothetical protein
MERRRVAWKKERSPIESSIHTLGAVRRPITAPKERAALLVVPIIGHEVVVEAETT